MSSSGQRVVPSTLTLAASRTQTLNIVISVDCKNYTTTWTRSFGNGLIMAAQNWQIYKFKPYSTFPLLLPSNMKYPLCWPYANVLTTHSAGFCHSSESKVIIHDLFFFPHMFDFIITTSCSVWTVAVPNQTSTIWVQLEAPQPILSGFTIMSIFKKLNYYLNALFNSNNWKRR